MGQLRGQSVPDSNILLNRKCYFGAGNGIRKNRIRNRDFKIGKVVVKKKKMKVSGVLIASGYSAEVIGKSIKTSRTHTYKKV